MARRVRYASRRRSGARGRYVRGGLLPGPEVVKLIKADARNKAKNAAARALLKRLAGEQDIRSRNVVGPSYADAAPFQKAVRRAINYRGAGDYKSVMAGLSRGVGTVAGAGLGFMHGGVHGAIDMGREGYGKGASFSKMMGWGDYGPVSGNQLMVGEGPEQQISVNQSDASGDIYVSHTEFVQNVYASVSSAPAQSSFQITQFPVNCGLQVTFPFMSQIAQNYELYKFEGLMFQYKPTSGEYGNNSSNAIGKVIMATNYDPDAAPFLNAVQMENYDYANSSKPSCGMIHGVETAPGSSATSMLYVRTGSSTKDKVFTDIGNFFIATEGIPFGGTGPQQSLLGELWVTYRLRLSRANLYGSLLGGNVASDVFTGTSVVAALANTVVAKSTNSIGCSVSNVSATSLQIKFPINISLGYYQVVVEFNNTSGFGTTIVGGLTSATNCSLYYPARSLPGAGGPEIFPYPAATTANIQQIGQVFYLKVQASGNLQASINCFVSAALPINTTYQITISGQNGFTAETTL